MAGAPVDHVAQLEAIENQIATALQSAGLSLTEMSKDKPSVKQMENHTSNFLKTLGSVHSDLATQITYLTQVSTGQPHEGSSYAAQKDLQMAHFRMEHVRKRLGELEKLRNEHLHQQGVQRAISHGDPLQSLQRKFTVADSTTQSQPVGAPQNTEQPMQQNGTT